MHARRRKCIYARTYTHTQVPAARGFAQFRQLRRIYMRKLARRSFICSTAALSLSLSLTTRYNTRRCHRNASCNARVTRALRDAFDERLHRMPSSSTPSPLPPVSGRRAEMRQSRAIIVGLWISDIP